MYAISSVEYTVMQGVRCTYLALLFIVVYPWSAYVHTYMGDCLLHVHRCGGGSLCELHVCADTIYIHTCICIGRLFCLNMSVQGMCVWGDFISLMYVWEFPTDE